MLILATAVFVVLFVSFLCSIFEAVLLSVTRPQIEVLVHNGRRSGPLLARFKDNMDVPIAAIPLVQRLLVPAIPPYSVQTRFGCSQSCSRSPCFYSPK